MTTTRPRFSGSRTVAITGATGMVGRHLVEGLLARGVTTGGGFRPLHPTPGVVNWLVWRLFIRPILRRFPRVDPTPVDHALHDGQVLPVAGGLTVLHTPGHCAGQGAC